MDKDTVVKFALSGLIGASSSAMSEDAQPVPPRPIDAICKILETTEDGVGLDQDIIDFLNELESQGRILECSTKYAEEELGNEWPSE